MGTHVFPTGRQLRSGKAILLAGISTNCAIQPSACVLPMITPKLTSNALVDIRPYVVWNAILPTTRRPPNGKHVSGNDDSIRCSYLLPTSPEISALHDLYPAEEGGIKKGSLDTT